jgi:O-succinylbenzoate synthase
MRLIQRANKMDFRFAYRRYTLPFRAPVRTSGGIWAVREGLYVRLERPDGSLGVGEASPLPSFGSESVDELEACCRTLGTGVDEQVLARIPVKLATLRNALACALGNRLGPPRNPSLGVAALVGPGRTAPVEAAAKAEAGFRTIKWKVGAGDAEDELAILDDVLAGLPSGSKVRLDANGAWSRRTAERWLARCADRPIEFVEQPVAPDAKAADDLLMGLSGDYPVPIALDESIRTDGDVQRWLGLGWPGYYVIKPALLGDAGGVLAALGQAGAKVVFSSSLETGIGARWALRTAFSWPGSVTALGFGVWPLFERAIFDGPAAAPFIRAGDLEGFDSEALWSAAS